MQTTRAAVSLSIALCWSLVAAHRVRASQEAIPTVTVTALGAAVVPVVVAKQQLSRTEAREAMACL